MSQGKSADVGVGGAGVFEEGVDGHAGEGVVALAEVYQVEVDHLLLD